MNTNQFRIRETEYGVTLYCVLPSGVDLIVLQINKYSRQMTIWNNGMGGELPITLSNWALDDMGLQYKDKSE